MSDDIMDLVGKAGPDGERNRDGLAEGTVTLPVIFALREGDAPTIRKVLAPPDPSPELLEAGIAAVLATDAVARTEAWAKGRDRRSARRARAAARVPRARVSRGYSLRSGRKGCLSRPTIFAAGLILPVPPATHK